MGNTLIDMQDRLDAALHIAQTNITEGKDRTTIEYLVANGVGVSLRKAKEYLNQLVAVRVISFPKPLPKVKEVENPNEISFKKIEI